ncbi:MAG: ion channel [Planctomycetota bacterium]
MEENRRSLLDGTLRQGGEVVAIVLIAALLQGVIGQKWLSPHWACVLVAVVAAGKTGFFFVEDLQQILLATVKDIPYHRFMALMLVNMVQIILSFGLDFWCLMTAESGSLSAFNPAFTPTELMFECLYYSFLNFTYFGFGDSTPQTIPAKLVTMMELLLAFFTVIFLLSDFISLKDSLRPPRSRGE